MIRFILVITLLVASLKALAQNDTVQILNKKGDAYLSQRNYEQARYYYNLALSFTPKDTTKKSLDNLIQCKIITVDSLFAYSCENTTFIKLLKKGDSLRKCCEIASIQAYDQALNINKQYEYPSNRISDIIEESPEIQEILLIIDAQRKRHLYSSELDLAMLYYNKGDKFKAMRVFEKMSIMFKGDTLTKSQLTKLKTELKEEIETFDNLLFEGDSLFKLGEISNAKLKLEAALRIDKDCNFCSIKIKNINFLMASSKKPQDWDLLRINAKGNYTIGNYEMAYYQFTWLYKHDSNDLYTSKIIEEIEEILSEELDEKMIITNAKLLLEAADHEFILGHYAKAKNIYLKIENRYSKATEYLIYVKERIMDCQHYLDNREILKKHVINH